ncbi:TRAP transporter substrate-binding protein DctP [Algihabitans albus]|uniref:TRAP transporter substrate-binding protein DctP n=1 Tax=Algihabitans albus TaxID=2164067 RepID=UPI001ABCFBD8|nr:TRAP transporter substrate-binding protein DctP [Algihabitans albus]
MREAGHAREGAKPRCRLDKIGMKNAETANSAEQHFALQNSAAVAWSFYPSIAPFSRSCSAVVDTGRTTLLGLIKNIFCIAEFLSAAMSARRYNASPVKRGGQGGSPMTLMTTFKVAALAAAAVATAFVAAPAPADAQDTVRWRVQSHWPSASSSFSDSLERLKATLEARTDGRFVLQLHEAGALFPAREIFSAVSRGIIEMGTISPAYIRDRVSVAGIASGLPFAFRNTWEAAYFHKNLGFEEMIRTEAAEHGVFYATDKVYPTEMVVKAPIESLADFESLKIRSSGALQEFLTEAGAAATYLPGPELYPALATGVVDGAHWGAAQGAKSMGLYEVAKYHVQPALNIAGTDAFVISQDAIDALPEDLRDILLNALEEQFWFRTNEYTYKEQIALAAAIAEQDVQVARLPDEVTQHLAATATAAWDKEAEKSEMAAEALEKLKSFLADLGYIQR